MFRIRMCVHLLKNTWSMMSMNFIKLSLNTIFIVTGCVDLTSRLFSGIARYQLFVSTNSLRFASQHYTIPVKSGYSTVTRFIDITEFLILFHNAFLRVFFARYC